MVTRAEALAELARRGIKVPTPARPMPAGVTNSLNTEIENVGGGTAVNARIEPYRADLGTGKMNLGPVRNLFMDAQNYMGLSSPESRRYSTFRSDLEKMRNDSLRLNKGVQTEGDAVRAWNELFKNLNDEKLVAERLNQIQQYNDEAVRQKKAIVDDTRSQYGLGSYAWDRVETPRTKYMKGVRTPAQVPRKGLSSPASNGMSDDDIKKALGL